jgi:cell division protein FtsB
MSDIRAYRQIVELQAEIVRLSQKNAELENRCKEVHADLISQHKKQTTRKAPARAVLGYVSDRSVAVGNHVIAAMRSPALKPILQRVWQSMV